MKNNSLGACKIFLKQPLLLESILPQMQEGQGVKKK